MKNKKYWLFLGFFQGNMLHAQIQVTGSINKPTTIQVDQIESRKIGRIPILNHNGVKKQPITKAKGILFITALSAIELMDSNPKNFSRYIYTIRAKDGYSVTFSWNELYNTSIGKRVFLLTETESHPNNGIILISKFDRYTGRRFVKDVSEIQIERK